MNSVFKNQYDNSINYIEYLFVSNYFLVQYVTKVSNFIRDQFGLGWIVVVNGKLATKKFEWGFFRLGMNLRVYVSYRSS